jgi:hypothetical protein
METPWSETTLVANMVRYSQRFLFLRKPHLTFHIGDSRTWLHKDLADYRQYNTEEFARILTEMPDEVLGNDTIRWFVQKMKGELQSHYSDECHNLCSKVALLF